MVFVIKKNKCLVIYVLTPMLSLSLISFHLTNINGIADFTIEKKQETKEEMIERLRYKRLAIGKYSSPVIEYWIGHLFYIIIMFLINSIYTAELKPKNIGSIKNIENEEQKLKNENNIKNEEEKEEKEEDIKDVEKKDEEIEENKKVIMYDTQNSINDDLGRKTILNKSIDDENNEQKKGIKKKIIKEEDKDIIIRQKKTRK